jgi:hypothetical protein
VQRVHQRHPRAGAGRRGELKVMRQAQQRCWLGVCVWGMSGDGRAAAVSGRRVSGGRAMWPGGSSGIGRGGARRLSGPSSPPPAAGGIAAAR